MKKQWIVLAMALVMLLAGCQARTAIPADSLQDTENETTSYFSGSKTEPTESESESQDMAENTEESEVSETPVSETDSTAESSEPPVRTESKDTVTTPEKKDDTQTKPGEVPQKEPEPEPAKPAEPVNDSKPEVTVTPEPLAPEPKSIYDYEFDVEAIRQELIAIGTGMGLTHTGDMTPATASWANPVTASQSFQGSGLERSLKDYVRSMPDIITMYGGTTIQYFTIYAEPLGGGSYRFYFLY